MVLNVVKRNGNLQQFDRNKLVASIKKAAIDAGLSLEELGTEIELISENVTKKIESKSDVDVSEIRKEVLDQLEDKMAVAAVAWRDFDGKYKSK